MEMTKRSAIAKALFGILTYFVVPAVGLPQDWPQWRGPNRDGVVHGVTVPRQWPETLTEEWKVPVGEGVASPVVVGNKVYLVTRQAENEEVVLCLDVASGTENWRSAYPAPYQLGGPAHGFEGPRSTPALAYGSVFTFGISGILSCLDAETGNLVWRKDFVGQYRQTAPGWGTSASPMVAEGLCILHVGGDQGGLTAFDAKSGDGRWCYDGDGPAYGSPILVDLAGQLQVVTLTLNHFLGVSASTGRLLWSLPCREIHSENCATPVRYDDLLIFAGRKEPPRAIRLERSTSGITPTEVWKGDGPTLYMSSPVLAGNLLFGLSERRQGQFFCLDAETGKTLWESAGRLESSAAILNAVSVWLVLTTKGKLIVVKPSGSGYEPIAEYRVSDTSTWAHPVVLGNRILIKDQNSLRSLRIDSGGGLRVEPDDFPGAEKFHPQQ
jgi:outer membrane protein assembly factor BamB